MADNVIFIGSRVRGKTFRAALAENSDWVEWALKQPQPTHQLADFVAYARAARGAAASIAGGRPAASSPAAVVAASPAPRPSARAAASPPTAEAAAVRGSGPVDLIAIPGSGGVASSVGPREVAPALPASMTLVAAGMTASTAPQGPAAIGVASGTSVARGAPVEAASGSAVAAATRYPASAPAAPAPSLPLALIPAYATATLRCLGTLIGALPDGFVTMDPRTGGGSFVPTPTGPGAAVLVTDGVSLFAAPPVSPYLEAAAMAAASVAGRQGGGAGAAAAAAPPAAAPTAGAVGSAAVVPAVRAAATAAPSPAYAVASPAAAAACTNGITHAGRAGAGPVAVADGPIGGSAASGATLGGPAAAAAARQGTPAAYSGPQGPPAVLAYGNGAVGAGRGAASAAAPRRASPVRRRRTRGAAARSAASAAAAAPPSVPAPAWHPTAPAAPAAQTVPLGLITTHATATLRCFGTLIGALPNGFLTIDPRTGGSSFVPTPTGPGAAVLVTDGVSLFAAPPVSPYLEVAAMAAASVAGRQGGGAGAAAAVAPPAAAPTAGGVATGVQPAARASATATAPAAAGPVPGSDDAGDASQASPRSSAPKRPRASTCAICEDRPIASGLAVAFGCGHSFCATCATHPSLRDCPMCRTPITARITLFF